MAKIMAHAPNRPPPAEGMLYCLQAHRQTQTPRDRSMSLRPSSFAILGASLMARLWAVDLARRGQRVAFFDAGSAAAEQAAATTAAAMLAPLAESAITEPGVVRMGQYALTRWP